MKVILFTTLKTKKENGGIDLKATDRQKNLQHQAQG